MSLATNPHSGTARRKPSPLHSTCSPTCAGAGAKIDESRVVQTHWQFIDDRCLSGTAALGGVHEKGADWIHGLVDRRDLLPPAAEATKYWFGTGAAGTTCASISGATDPGRYLSWTATWACMGSGDTFHIKAGSYSQRIYEFTINVPNGIDAAHPTIIEGEGATGCAVAENCNTVFDLRWTQHRRWAVYYAIRNLSIYGNDKEQAVAFDLRIQVL